MPVLILKALDCEKGHSGSSDFNVRIQISPDEKSTEKVKVNGIRGRRSILNKHVLFGKKVDIQLITAGTIKIGDTLTLNAERLPHEDRKGNRSLHRGFLFVGEGASDYHLWYEVLPEGTSEQEFHRSAFFSPSISLWENFARMGRGALTKVERDTVLHEKMNYRSNEATSLKDVIVLHRHQDGTGGNTNVRQWVYNHCNAWGEESPIPIDHLPERGGNLLVNPNYDPVSSELSHVLGGFVVKREYASIDNPTTHTTRDFNFDILPSPQFNYLLAYTTYSKNVEKSNFPTIRVPVIHVEWETGSMPREWRPEVGEYVTVWGRLIFDLGHLPMKTEIHPVHSIVREFTTSDGEKEKFNRAIIGMGFSGGFPGSTQAQFGDELKRRWELEFGDYIPDLTGFNRRCWPTNLKKHTLHKKLFPPRARRNRNEVLRERVNDYKLIFITQSRINDFLKECTGKAVAENDIVHKNFKDWFPDNMVEKPSPLGKPGLISRGDYFDLIVDLGSPQGIPVAYYAEIDIGWDL